MTDDLRAMPTLADEFETLAKAATPGPWLVRYMGSMYPEPAPPEWYLTDESGEPLYTNMDFYPGDGRTVEFVAFCGTNRERIAAALRAFEAVRAALAPYEGQEPWTTTSADCDHDSCERLAAVQALLEGKK